MSLATPVCVQQDRAQLCVHRRSCAIQIQKQIVLIRRRQFGRGGGRRRPQVGDEICDREVDLVANPADDRNAARRDRPRHSFIIEAP